LLTDATKIFNRQGMSAVVDTDLLKVPKIRKPVTLWVHPEGRVLGNIFLLEQSMRHSGPEDPLEALNKGEPFLVFEREDPDQLRFYNRRSIIRVEYSSSAKPPAQWDTLHCQLAMMDGAQISGTIREPLPPDRARLLDYFNRNEDNFIRIYVDEDQIYLINKAYINHVYVDQS
jgi:hypothetical protein